MSNKGNRKWFALIEVLVSALILTVSVFGILRLSSNNSNQAKNLDKSNDMDDLLYDSSECIKSFSFDYLNGLTSTQSLSFSWDNSECLTWSYNTNLSFSSITLKSYDWNGELWSDEYWSYFSVNPGTDSVSVNETVTNWKNTKNIYFKVYKK